MLRDRLAAAVVYSHELAFNERAFALSLLNQTCPETLEIVGASRAFRRLGCSQRTGQRRLRAFEERGWVRREVERWRDEGAWRARSRVWFEPSFLQMFSTALCDKLSREVSFLARKVIKKAQAQLVQTRTGETPARDAPIDALAAQALNSTATASSNAAGAEPLANVQGHIESKAILVDSAIRAKRALPILPAPLAREGERFGLSPVMVCKLMKLARSAGTTVQLAIANSATRLDALGLQGRTAMAYLIRVLSGQGGGSEERGKGRPPSHGAIFARLNGKFVRLRDGRVGRLEVGQGGDAWLRLPEGYMPLHARTDLANRFLAALAERQISVVPAS